MLQYNKLVMSIWTLVFGEFGGNINLNRPINNYIKYSMLRKSPTDFIFS